MNKKAASGLTLLVLFFSILSAMGKDEGPWKDLYQKVGDLKIHYLEAGTGDRIVVFIPGWTMPAEVWREQITYFASRGFHVIALDPRSQGLTTKTESGNTFQQQAADLHAFFQSLKIEPSYLVGWDTGVSALLDYLASPETMKPDKIVFVDGSPAALKTDDFPGAVTAQDARKLLFSFQDNRSKATDQLIHGMFKASQPAWLIKDLKAASLKTPMDAAVSMYFDFFTGDRRSELNYVVFPCLIVAAPENRAVGEYMKSKIERSKLEIIEGTGSAVFLDKPQAFNQILEDFLGAH